MARINTRPSYQSTAASSRYPSATPAPSDTSDQENADPSRRRMDKGKGRASDLPSRTSLPTPTSDEISEARAGQKRKRGPTRATQPEEEDVGEEELAERKFNRYYDPNQDPEERREVKRKSRALERQFQEQRDDLLRDDGNALRRTVQQANNIFADVKQTNDATLDSRLLVNVSDLANKKSAQLVLGDSSTGVDVDEFLTKCITYMRNGGPLERDADDDIPASTSRRRRTHNHDDSDDEDDDVIGAPLDWEVLGRHACFPYNARPCVPSFLLGPLSVEKKTRIQTQRRARQAKDTAGREARPEALSREDLSQSDENGLTAICTRIRKHLNKHIETAEQDVSSAGFSKLEDLKSERGRDILKKHRMSDNGGVSLFDYVLNPRSFGQTVENLFYVSFLIKEGSFGIQNDSDGLPTILPSEPSTVEQQRANKSSKHQAVFSLDYKTWRELIDAFDVRDPMIPHRAEAEAGTQVGQRGWYT